MSPPERRERPRFWGALFGAAGLVLVAIGITWSPIRAAIGIAAGVALGALIARAFPAGGPGRGDRGVSQLVQGFAVLGGAIGLTVAVALGGGFLLGLIGGLLATSGVTMLRRGRTGG